MSDALITALERAATLHNERVRLLAFGPDEPSAKSSEPE
jgi:hypothetical protein